jgi:hypothetical protein
MDRCIGLCPRRHRQEAPQSGRFALHFITDISLTLFEKMPIQQVFGGSDYKSEQGINCNQLNLSAF